MARYLAAIVTALAVFAGGLFVVYRLGALETDLFKYLLLVISAAIVIAVSRPWAVGIHHTKSAAWSVAAWLAAIACVIIVLAIDIGGAILYGNSVTP
jgi:hypothetical protein